MIAVFLLFSKKMSQGLLIAEVSDRLYDQEEFPRVLEKMKNKQMTKNDILLKQVR